MYTCIYIIYIYIYTCICICICICIYIIYVHITTILRSLFEAAWAALRPAALARRPLPRGRTVLYIYIYCYLFIFVVIYIYIYTERERERERSYIHIYIYICIFIYIYIYIHTHIIGAQTTPSPKRPFSDEVVAFTEDKATCMHGCTRVRMLAGMRACMYMISSP